MLKSALKFANKGLPIFPVHGIEDGQCTCGKVDCTSPGKHPRTLNGCKSATTNVAQIQRWWEQWPPSNIGLLTGKKSGFIIVDIDPRHGGDDSFSELEKQHGLFPSTKEALTGGGGRHLYLKYPVIKVPNKTNLFPGIDIKSDGGYVIAPPSLHISGRHYEWEVTSYENNLSEAPEWLLNSILSRGFSHSDSQNYKVRDWKSLVEKPIFEGQRNASIASYAGHLLRKKVDPFFTLGICQSINQTTCKPPLPAEEVAKTVNSIASKEFQRRKELHHENS